MNDKNESIKDLAKAATKQWKKYAETYDPIRIGSIDGEQINGCIGWRRLAENTFFHMNNKRQQFLL